MYGSQLEELISVLLDDEMTISEDEVSFIKELEEPSAVLSTERSVGFSSLQADIRIIITIAAMYDK